MRPRLLASANRLSIDMQSTTKTIMERNIYVANDDMALARAACVNLALLTLLNEDEILQAIVTTRRYYNKLRKLKEQPPQPLAALNLPLL